MARRRYDTEALVGRIKAERRTGIILSVAGALILTILTNATVSRRKRPSGAIKACCKKVSSGKLRMSNSLQT